MYACMYVCMYCDGPYACYTDWCRRRDFDAAQEDAALAHLQDCPPGAWHGDVTGVMGVST